VIRLFLNDGPEQHLSPCACESLEFYCLLTLSLLDYRVAGASGVGWKELRRKGRTGRRFEGGLMSPLLNCHTIIPDGPMPNLARHGRAVLMCVAIAYLYASTGLT
jgi:hypothetical protein